MGRVAIVCGLRTMGRAITREWTKLYGSAIQSGLTLQIAMYLSGAQKKRYQGDMEIQLWHELLLANNTPQWLCARR